MYTGILRRKVREIGVRLRVRAFTPKHNHANANKGPADAARALIKLHGMAEQRGHQPSMLVNWYAGYSAWAPEIAPVPWSM